MSVNVDGVTVELGKVQNKGSCHWNFADNMSRKVIMLVYSKMADFRRIFPVYAAMLTEEYNIHSHFLGS